MKLFIWEEEYRRFYVLASNVEQAKETVRKEIEGTNTDKERVEKLLLEKPSIFDSPVCFEEWHD